MKETKREKDSEISVAISLTGDYDSLNEGLVALQKQGVEVCSLEGIEGWLVQTAKLSGVKEEMTSEFLTQYLSDPEFICLYNRLFNYLQRGASLIEEVQSEKTNEEKVQSQSMIDDEALKSYLEELYEKMN